MPKTTNALQILKSLHQRDPEIQAMIEDASLKARIAQMIYAARIQAELSQQQLADRIGTKQSVIAQLEDAD